ncbi:ABC transporter ATP-binding protein [Candidatus Palauibacter soopunensis]|uniref:ABC transporter ATP-binding protein n=1 Tax=Candidatus Palauibacter soopunensis TaxID=3056739 RepID=UPI002385DB3A|nr:ABC transporter ATP-binding protein [Candidatus Palauibacter soopunensis]MDE2879716.1 ABC transporter ATP-binding protein [Candidatus Palauibacter soopunensis]
MPESSGDRGDAAAYRLENVTFRYPSASSPALKDLSLEFGVAAFTAVIGPNGAGKSTLVRLLGGILDPSEGSVRLDGRPLVSWDRSALARRTAVVSQDAPPEALRVSLHGYVELGRNPYVSPWAPLAPRDREVIGNALRWAGLEHLARRPLAELSGGERQRAKLARAIVQEPGVLILDEPSAHLDFRHALWIFDALRERVRDRALTVICITHDMQLASRYADRMILLAQGEAVAAGPPGDVLGSPALASTYGCEVRVESLGDLGHSVLPVRARSRGATSGASSPIQVL